ncbi:MAG: hypothetical protein MJ002_09300 [Paludibacteraceae bacterium]|nr:hypothetical protein [Paludibacteraceae bacterium]
MKKTSREIVQLIAALFIALFGLALIAVAFYVPPKGVIDPTVLTAFGEILTFSGAILGLDYHYKAKISDHSPDKKE